MQWDDLFKYYPSLSITACFQRNRLRFALKEDFLVSAECCQSTLIGSLAHSAKVFCDQNSSFTPQRWEIARIVLLSTSARTWVGTALWFITFWSGLYFSNKSFPLKSLSTRPSKKVNTTFQFKNGLLVSCDKSNICFNVSC